MRRVTFRVPAGELDAVLDRLLPAVPGGVRVDEGAGECELAVIAARPPSADTVAELLGAIPAGWSEETVPADGRERRLAGGVRVGRIVVRPPQAPAPPAGTVDVVVEANSVVFGSGSHPTTRMCLDLLDGLAGHPRGGGAPALGGLADLGCGLGTLAIAAAKLGYDPVAAVDREPAAVTATRDHAARNGVAVSTEVTDLTAADPPWQPTLVLNAAPEVHERVARGLPASVRTVIASSFVEAEEAAILEPWRAAGLSVAERRTEDTWVALVLSRDVAPEREPPPAPSGTPAALAAAAPPAPGGEPLLARAEVLEPERVVAAGALGQLATRLPDGGMVISSSRTVEAGSRAALVYVPSLFRFDVTPQHETLGVAMRALVPVPSRWEADADTFDGFRRAGAEPVSFRGGYDLPDGTISIRIEAMAVPDDDQGAAHFVVKTVVRPA